MVGRFFSTQSGEMIMTKLRAIGAACLAAALAVASPAMAREGGHGGMGGGHGGFSGGHAAFSGGGHAAFSGGHAAFNGGHAAFNSAPATFGSARPAFSGGHAGFSSGGPARFAAGGPHGRFHHHGFGPGIAVGAALGGLGYYDGYYGDTYAYDYDDGYADAPYYYGDDQYACQPGTYFIGEDGLRHLCP
jgi:hypothetical protein